MDKRVLVVDDDAPTRRMIAAVLTRGDFKVDLCSDDSDAAECLSRDKYGAVILALVSQDPEVHDRILRNVAQLPEQPCVIVISAGTQTALDATASTLIKARLRKPFQIGDLIGAVESCFA
jgi:DNA-binding response OmpR family regulator